MPGIRDISNNPPVMEDSFDLYAVQLKTILIRLEFWSVVDGSETRPLFDVQEQVAFDARANAARDALLRGAPGIDAEMIVMKYPKRTCGSASRISKRCVNMQIIFLRASSSTQTSTLFI